MKKIVVIFTSLFLLFSCDTKEPKSEAQKPGGKQSTPSKKRGPQKEIFDGLIISSNATKLRAPIAYFSIRNWTSSASWVKLQKLAEDGTEVKKGDLVGGFEFHGKNALPKVIAAIAEAKADFEKGQVNDSSTRMEMVADIERSGLDAERLDLDVSRGDTISQREMKSFEIQRDLANFDVNASRQFLRAQRISDKSTQNALSKKVELAEEDQVRFKMFEERFKVRAPHDGVVRHARHRRRNRKIQQGDGMPSGMHFVSLAEDAVVEVTILIPEKKFKMAMSQKEYFVKSPNGDERYPVDVTSVESFPQTIGFAKQDTKLPNAREIVYIVHAKFRGEVGAGMKSGLEVKVELP